MALFNFLVFMSLLTGISCEMVSAKIGQGCPSSVGRCFSYCTSQGFNGGFCWKIVCCCMPKITNEHDLIRAFEEIKEKLKDLLQY